MKLIESGRINSGRSNDFPTKLSEHSGILLHLNGILPDVNSGPDFLYAPSPPGPWDPNFISQLCFLYYQNRGVELNFGFHVYSYNTGPTHGAHSQMGK